MRTLIRLLTAPIRLLTAPEFHKIIKVLFLWFVSVITLLLLWHAPTIAAYKDARLTRDIQIVLKLGGYYPGTFDGICGEQTLQAIRQYKDKTKREWVPVKCSASLLEILNTDFSTILQSAPQNKTDKVVTDISDIQTQLKNTEMTLKGLSDSVSTEFVAQFKNLSSIGVTAMITAISIIVASSGLIGNFLIKSMVETAHNKEIEKTRATLDKEIEKTRATLDKEIEKTEATIQKILVDAKEVLETTVTALLEITSAEVPANVFATIGGHCINLYIDNPDPSGKHKTVYESYLGVAITISKYGYLNSVALKESLKKRNKQASPAQERVIGSCLNNYVFYLAQSGAQEDQAELVRVLPELEERISAYPDEPNWWDYRDTLAWANLHLGRNTVQETKAIIELMLNNPSIPHQWKDATKKRYNFYDIFPQHTDKVGL